MPIPGTCSATTSQRSVTMARTVARGVFSPDMRNQNREGNAMRIGCKSMLLALVYAVAGALPLRAQSAASPDQEGVRRAVLDYVEGFYEGDTTRLVRSVAPTVHKYGYSKRDAEYVGSQMPYANFMSYANSIKEGRNRTPPDAPKEITLFDVQDQTASAKLTAWWGTDYLLLAKLNGRWMITHVLWQTAPPK